MVEPNLIPVSHDPFNLNGPVPEGWRDTNSLTRAIDLIFGTNGQERYQLWPEKMVRSGLSLPKEVYTGKVPTVDPETGRTSIEVIERAQDVAGLAGTGGLAGVGKEAGVALGSTPFLRPALKYEGKIYKAPKDGQHLDAIPENLRSTFEQQAMSGEDISNFNFGFMNHKGQFLNREAALDYGIKEGLIDPHAGQYGVLTTSLMADSSKPGVAIEALAKSRKPSNFTRRDLEQMSVDDLTKMAYGHVTGQELQLRPSQIKIKWKDDLVNPQDKFDKQGMDWAKSIDFSKPVKVSIDQKGKFNLEDGHHRWFAAQKLNKPLNVVIEKIDGKAIETILEKGILFSAPAPVNLIPVDHDPFAENAITRMKSNVEYYRQPGKRADPNLETSGPGVDYGIRPPVMDPDLPEFPQHQKNSLE